MDKWAKKFEIENILSQIYSNDYLYDGDFCSFTLQVNYILINFIYIYSKQVNIGFQDDVLTINANDVFIEIQYSDINLFTINLEEENNV